MEASAFFFRAPSIGLDCSESSALAYTSKIWSAKMHSDLNRIGLLMVNDIVRRLTKIIMT